MRNSGSCPFAANCGWEGGGVSVTTPELCVVSVVITTLYVRDVRDSLHTEN